MAAWELILHLSAVSPVAPLSLHSPFRSCVSGLEALIQEVKFIMFYNSIVYFSVTLLIVVSIKTTLLGEAVVNDVKTIIEITLSDSLFEDSDYAT